MEIYAADIRAFAPFYEEGLARLTAERRARAAALKRRDDALRSLCAGLLLRRYVGDGPFAAGEHGKPYLPGGPPFSLSHGGNLAVLAVADAPVGVDVEPEDRPWPAAVARRVLSAGERDWLAAEGGGRFLFLWTRKEAALKCAGLGFAVAPASFSVLPGAFCAPGGTACALSTQLFAGHILSAAIQGESAECAPVLITPDTLLA